MSEIRAITVDEFCGRNRQGRTTVYAEIKSGRLRSYKVGRSRRITLEDEAAWQRSYLEQAEPEHAAATEAA